MQDIIRPMLELFGIAEIPTDFATFIYWLCSLLAGLEFAKFSVGICFSFVKEMIGGRK